MTTIRNDTPQESLIVKEKKKKKVRTVNVDNKEGVDNIENDEPKGWSAPST